MSFLLTVLGAYLNSFFKMVEVSINDLLLEDPPDMKRQKLIKCILTGNSKQYQGKRHTLKNR